MIQAKTIVKGASVKVSQVEKVGKLVDLSRHGAWSQFVQDALDERLDRIFSQQSDQNEKKAS